MKNKSLKEYACLLEKRLGKEKAGLIMQDAQIRFEELVNANLQESKEVKAHTVEKIFPTIGLYESLLKRGMDKESAVALVDDILCTIAQGACQTVSNDFEVSRLIPASSQSIPVDDGY